MILRRLAILFSVLGLIISSYALYLHFRPLGDSWCDLSTAFSCDLVNKGPWSEIFGVPVAFFGIPGYSLLLILALFRPKNWRLMFLMAAVLGTAFSLYLTYLEAFVIFAWCIICLGSLITIISLGLIGLLLHRDLVKKTNLDPKR